MTTDFKKLQFYQLAEDFTIEIYELTKRFPKEEKYALISQLQRASTSVCLNLAEGCGRDSEKEMVHFFFTSMGSLKEVSSILSISLRLSYISRSQFEDLNTKLETISRMIGGYIKKVRAGFENA
ncbi:MAG: four helix bundle protein [Candidatus Nanoarchaeia archaeon]